MRIAITAGTACVGLCALALGADQVGFDPPTIIEVDRAPDRVFAADVNDDQNVDLILSGVRSTRITLMLGNGDGTFGTSTEFTLPSIPLSLAAADLNGDDHLDIVTGHQGTLVTFDPQNMDVESAGDVHVLLSDGSGGYSGSELTIQGRQPAYILFLDYDGDLDLDLVLGTSDGASVLENDGNGAFSGARLLGNEYDTRTMPFAIADLNGDTHPDLVAYTPLLGDGTGNFTASGTNLVGLGGSPVAVDVDGDGDVDLASIYGGGFPPSGATPDNVFIQLNDGAGNFTDAGTYATIAGPADLRAADLNGDGRPEMISRSQWGRVGVLVNAGDGTFEHLNTFRHGPSGTPWGVATADLDEDGRQDLVTCDLGTGGIVETLAIHRGTAAAAPVVTDYQPRSALLGETVDITFTGQGFDAGATIEFFAADVWVLEVENVRVDSATSFTATVKVGDGVSIPVSAGERPMEMRNGDGRSVPLSFTVELGPLPVVTGVTPATGRAGDTLELVLAGTDFADDVTVALGAGALVNGITREADDRIRASVTLGSAAGPVDVTVTNTSTGRTSTLDGAFTILPPLTLDLVQLQGKLVDRVRAGRDSIHVSGVLEFNALSADGTFAPGSDDVTVRVGDPAAPFVFSVNGGDSGWRSRNGKHVWRNPRRSRPRVTLELDTDRKRFRVVVAKADLTLPADGRVLVDLTAGDDDGDAVRTWQSARRGLRLR